MQNQRVKKGISWSSYPKATTWKIRVRKALFKNLNGIGSVLFTILLFGEKYHLKEIQLESFYILFEYIKGSREICLLPQPVPTHDFNPPTNLVNALFHQYLLFLIPALSDFHSKTNYESFLDRDNGHFDETATIVSAFYSLTNFYFVFFTSKRGLLTYCKT